MKKIQTITLAALIAGGGLTLLPSCARQAGIPGSDGAATDGTHGASLRQSVSVTIAANKPIPNVPGKRLVSVVVDYPPGAASTSHRHAPSAFIYAYVLSGAVRSQVDDEPVRVYHAGETWFENPGAHHRVSENASDTEPARLLAVFVVDAADEPLTTPDSR